MSVFVRRIDPKRFTTCLTFIIMICVIVPMVHLLGSCNALRVPFPLPPRLVTRSCRGGERRKCPSRKNNCKSRRGVEEEKKKVHDIRNKSKVFEYNDFEPSSTPQTGLRILQLKYHHQRLPYAI
jgi:hypothetical protein